MKVNMRERQISLGVDILSKDQIEEIHSATMEVLEKVGVEVLDQEGLNVLKKGGARIDGSRAYIPSWMVKRALSTVPSRVTLSDRNGETALVLEKNRIYYGTGSDTPYVLDLDGKRRRVLIQDVINAARLCDALENIDFIMSAGLASDVPPEQNDIYQVEAMVSNCTKPFIYTAFNRENLAKIIEMAEIVAGGPEELQARPFLNLYNEPNSPLKHSQEAVQKLLYMAEKRLPMNYTPAVMRGGTGPVTAAGALVVANSELLSGLVMHQLKGEGAPFIYGGGTPPLDLRTMVSSYAAPEVQLGSGALATIGRYYGLPVFHVGGCSDSHVFDQQAGMEAGYSLLMAGLSGGNLIHDNGYLSAGMMFSLEMLVLCNETIGVVKHILQGIEVNAETLATEVIASVGPGGNYYGEDHTFRHFKTSMHFPDLLDRRVYDNWSKKPTNYGDRANKKARDVLRDHKVSELSQKTLERMKQVY